MPDITDIFVLCCRQDIQQCLISLISLLYVEEGHLTMLDIVVFCRQEILPCLISLLYVVGRKSFPA